MDFGRLFSPSYLFDATIPAFAEFGTAILAVIVVLLVIGVMSKIVAMTKIFSLVITRAANRLGNALLSVGLLCLVVWFSRQQLIPFFGARFWWWIFALMLVYWLWLIVRDALRYQKNLEKTSARVNVYDRYLPKKR